MVVGLLWTLSIVAGIAAFVGFIWLLVHAFRDSTLWGVLVLLFSPITAVIFAVRNWQESKKPFLLYAGSVAANVVCSIAVVVIMGAGIAREMQAQIEAGLPEADPEPAVAQPAPPEPESDEASADAILANREEGALEVLDDTMLAELLPQADEEPLRRGYVAIPLSEAGRHIGKKAKVIEPGGHEFVGRLEDGGSRGVVLSRFMSSGSAEVTIRRSEIDRLMVYFP